MAFMVRVSGIPPYTFPWYIKLVLFSCNVSEHVRLVAFGRSLRKSIVMETKYHSTSIYGVITNMVKSVKHSYTYWHCIGLELRNVGYDFKV